VTSTQGFFASRWVSQPAHVTATPGGLPAGFRAASAGAGIKPGGAIDLGLLVCDSAQCVSAARYTRSGVLAAPVLVSRDETTDNAVRAVVANSGNANAATGPDGMHAALEAQTAELLLSVCVKRSFDRISVDGQLSTNDTVILMCSGASGFAVAPESEDEVRFGEALDALLRMLAVMIVRDGEGARRVGRVVVRGGHAGAVERCARAIANSPLVKTALHGADPNWGRIAQSAGQALQGAAPLLLDIRIEGIDVCVGGVAVPYDLDALNAAAAGSEIEYEVGLPGAGHETEVFFSDLSHEYVTINAEYTT